MSVGLPQQILSGKYRLERELGRGGMGAVWLAEHLTLRSPVAIKLIDPGIAENPEALSRFLREAQAAASLRSPHVVQILDHGVDEGVPFIVMELLEGESQTARIMTQVARAVTRAHEAGIIHRDLKPDNIFLVRNDEEEVAKVLDFGVAKASSHGMGAATGATRTGSVLGTPYYMSPEQAEGAKRIDHRSDLWSLGVIAWECLLGTRPFDAETLGGLLLAICARDIPVPSTMGVVPAGFDAWFARACSRDVAYRFGSAKELATELRQVCSGAGSEYAGHAAGPVSSGQGVAVSAASLPLASTMSHLGMSSSHEPSKRKSAVPLLVGVSVALVVAGGVAFVRLSAPGETAASSSSSPAAPVASSPKVEPAPAVVVASEPAKVEPSAVASATTSAPPAAAPAVVAQTPRPRVVGALKPAKDKTPAAPPAAAAPAPQPQPQPTARPRVNLGI